MSETRICFRHLPQKLSKPRFLANTGPPRKPSSRENFPLPGILSIFWIESSVYIYYRYPPREDDGSIYTTVILPSRFFLNDALSEIRIRLRHLPQKLSEPRFLANTGARRKPSSRGIFPLPCILSLFWIESSVYIYYRYPPREDTGSIYIPTKLMMAKGSVTKSLKHCQRKQAISQCKRLDDPDQPKYIIYRKNEILEKVQNKSCHMGV